MADNFEVLRRAIASRADYEDRARIANKQLSEARDGLRAVLIEFVGEVLPLAGVANTARFQVGDFDSDPVIYSVQRKSIMDSGLATFGPGYFKLNQISDLDVVLGAPEGHNPNVGLVALIDSIRIASDEEIELVNRTISEGVVQ